VNGPTSGADESDLGYVYSLTYRDGTQQSVQPYFHDDAYVASLRGRGIEVKVNRNNGVISAAGASFRPSYFVRALDASTREFWLARRDTSGLAYRGADLNGDGTSDIEVISATGVQVVYRLR
jgi:hypothetical protein